MNIITALRVKLTDGEQARVLRRGTNSLKAYEKYLQGIAYFRRISKTDNILGRELFEEAIALDPEYVLAYVWLG